MREEISYINPLFLGGGLATVNAVHLVGSSQSVARSSALQGFPGGAKLFQQLFHLILFSEENHQFLFPIFFHTFYMIAGKYPGQCLSHTLLPEQNHQFLFPIFFHTFDMIAGKYPGQCLSHTLLPAATFCNTEKLILRETGAAAEMAP